MMPCIFCIAVFLTLVGAVTAGVLDSLEERLDGKTATPVKRIAESDSMARMEFSMAVGRKTTPVVLTVFKHAKRVRIQIMSHDITRDEAQDLQNRLADLLELRIVERSDPRTEELVSEALHAHDHEHKDLPQPTREGPQR
jgi:hypothetical protein